MVPVLEAHYDSIAARAPPLEAANGINNDIHVMALETKVDATNIEDLLSDCAERAMLEVEMFPVLDKLTKEMYYNVLVDELSPSPWLTQSSQPIPFGSRKTSTTHYICLYPHPAHLRTCEVDAVRSVMAQEMHGLRLPHPLEFKRPVDPASQPYRTISTSPQLDGMDGHAPGPTQHAWHQPAARGPRNGRPHPYNHPILRQPPDPQRSKSRHEPRLSAVCRMPVAADSWCAALTSFAGQLSSSSKSAVPASSSLSSNAGAA
ncbi:hypothetical protein BDK51DRAFT_49717 [Blyttiomyces helicus]|uniref:Uncharacterized protein n=1 Tax=Blyttiomyces helicus TaxID=388810 RepID=A0A4P9VYL8_9FUNG|nr:hypothetical protein BDK51DRAFT_49717 [Blyttiomyces helicus]|eukprot:RKO83398.1 hypothetical protein BDK51DRAFT_49717 [Blyttiomyces helicus]